MTRLDKITAKQLNISRTQAKAMIKNGEVCVNGAVVKSVDFKCSDDDKISAGGKEIERRDFVYIMMNKPKGVISASEGKSDKTVIDLLPDEMKRKGLFPAGRLDKDTTGFVLITDDGAFAHDILSPSHHIDKTYIATLDKPFDDVVINDFKSGMTLGGEKLLKAEITPLNNECTVAEVVLRQGLYHQVKRMFKKHGITVIELKRTKMGNLPLDKTLKPGESRYISENELKSIVAK